MLNNLAYSFPGILTYKKIDICQFICDTGPDLRKQVYKIGLKLPNSPCGFADPDPMLDTTTFLSGHGCPIRHYNNCTTAVLLAVNIKFLKKTGDIIVGCVLKEQRK